MISPGSREGLIPLAIPLSQNNSGELKHVLMLVATLSRFITNVFICCNLLVNRYHYCTAAVANSTTWVRCFDL